MLYVACCIKQMKTKLFIHDCTIHDCTIYNFSTDTALCACTVVKLQDVEYGKWAQTCEVKFFAACDKSRTHKFVMAVINLQENSAYWVSVRETDMQALHTQQPPITVILD